MGRSKLLERRTIFSQTIRNALALPSSVGAIGVPLIVFVLFQQNCQKSFCLNRKVKFQRATQGSETVKCIVPACVLNQSGGCVPSPEQLNVLERRFSSGIPISSGERCAPWYLGCTPSQLRRFLKKEAPDALLSHKTLANFRLSIGPISLGEIVRSRRSLVRSAC